MKQNMAICFIKYVEFVIPAKAGIHFNQTLRWIPCFREDDEIVSF